MEKLFAEVWRRIASHHTLGVGTGSTVEAWLDYGFANGYSIPRAVASSDRTAKILRSSGTDVVDLQSESRLAAYVDSADEVNSAGVCIKGGGGAMTLEKIVRSASNEFICMVSNQKLKKVLGDFPIAVEVLPFARSYVGRALLNMGGDPVYREGFKTDSGNIILDVYGLDLRDISSIEAGLNQVLGIVGHGLFFSYAAEYVYVEDNSGYQLLICRDCK